MTTLDARAVTAMSALTAFDAAGIRYCVLRNHEQIPVDPGRDIDVVVGDDDLNHVESILKTMATQYEWPLLFRCRGHHEGTSYYFIDPNPPVVRQLELHFTRVRWARLPVLTPEQLLAGRVRAGHGLWVASEFQVAVQRLVQFGLAGKLADMKQEYMDSLIDVTRGDPEGVKDALSNAGVRNTTAATLVGLVIRGDMEELQRRMRQLRRWFIVSGIRQEPLATGDLARLLFARARPLSRPRCGLVVQGASQELIDSVRTMFLSVARWDGERETLPGAIGAVGTVGLVLLDSRGASVASGLEDVTLSLNGLTPDLARRAVVERFGANHVTI